MKITGGRVTVRIKYDSCAHRIEILLAALITPGYTGIGKGINENLSALALFSGQIILCCRSLSCVFIALCSAASLTCDHQKPETPAPPSCNKQKCSQTLQSVLTSEPLTQRQPLCGLHEKRVGIHKNVRGNGA